MRKATVALFSSVGMIVGTAMALMVLALIIPRLAASRSEKFNLRMKALTAQIKANPRDKESLNTLITLLNSSDEFEGASAAIALGAAGPNAEPAVDALAQSLTGGNPFAARESAISLGLIGPPARRAVPALLNAVRQHANSDVGWFAAESLGKIADPNDPVVNAVLENGEASQDERMRFSAVKGLHELRSRQQSRTGVNPTTRSGAS